MSYASRLILDEKRKCDVAFQHGSPGVSVLRLDVCGPNRCAAILEKGRAEDVVSSALVKPRWLLNQMRSDAFEPFSRRFGAGAASIPVQMTGIMPLQSGLWVHSRVFPSYAPLSRWLFMVSEQRALSRYGRCSLKC